MSIRSALAWNFLGGLIFPFVACAYENVALHKAAWQQNPPLNNQYNASLAVDGRKENLSPWGGECVLSGRSETAEWRVDLKSVLSIHHILIQYAQINRVWDKDDFYTTHLLGFSLYVSNTTNKEEGVLCFRDSNYSISTVPNPVNITCSYHGRYVIYHNNRTHPPFPVNYTSNAYSDLCEVEVYGCPSPGFYGEDCSIPCPQNCQDGFCHIVEGTCLGCLPGYRGLRCNEECKQLTYGLECNKTCGNCSKGEQCNHVNGSCLSGCDVGVHGDKCDSECPQGQFGEDCLQYCSKHCVISGKCDRVTGHCTGGCQAGWKNAQCDQKCDGNMFGKHCKDVCGKCLNGGQCHHINGSCLYGCNPGYYGIDCREECPDGKYGHNCEENCSSNCMIPGKCEGVKGGCEVGCQEGWKNAQCDQECDGGMFGQNCNQSCGKCLDNEQCHHINGSCFNGCDSGYHGANCTEGTGKT
ncbi:uncharacterized protein LOC111113742 [Crassostrea virginica]